MRRDIKKVLCKIGLGFALFVAACAWVVPAPPAQAQGERKAVELERKIADITLLRRQLADRTRLAEETCRALFQERGELASEIAAVTKERNIKTLQQARENLRVKNNIELLGIIAGYVKALEEKMLFYRTGCDKLAYLQQSATDDLKMIAALNDLKIDALSTQISLVISQYLPEAHVINLDAAAFQSAPAERVWEDLAVGSY